MSNKQSARQLAAYGVACRSRFTHSSRETRLTAPFQPCARTPLGPAKIGISCCLAPPRCPRSSWKHVANTPSCSLDTADCLIPSDLAAVRVTAPAPPSIPAQLRFRCSLLGRNKAVPLSLSPLNSLAYQRRRPSICRRQDPGPG
jgi:hypothetical protein